MLQERLDKLQNADADRASRLDLLSFQLQEREALAVTGGEFENLQAERQKLKHSGSLAEGVSAAMTKLSADIEADASSLLADAGRAIESLVEFDSELGPVGELLESASIQISEAVDALQRYGESIDTDPARRDWVEERLDAMQSVARKHRVEVKEVWSLTEKIRSEHDELSHAEERGRELEEQLAASFDDYRKHATLISTACLLYTSPSPRD